MFGKFGGIEEGKVDDGIVNTSFGGAWTLKNLDGKRFGSADL